MDEDTIELIRLLCTRAGMAMEDASSVALLAPADHESLRSAIEQLEASATLTVKLIAAARALAASS